MLTAVLFELDGVLVDTWAARKESLAAAFAAEGLDGSPTLEGYDVSDPFDDAVRTVAATRSRAGSPTVLALDDTALALVALRAEREYAARLAAGVTLADGAREAVEALGAACRLGVVTAWRRADAERVLALAGLDASIRFVAAADDGPGFASAVGRFARAVARLQRDGRARPGDVAALVAGGRGITAARAAGARAVLVGEQVPLRGLSPARLIAALDRVPQSGVALPQSLSLPR